MTIKSAQRQLLNNTTCTLTNMLTTKSEILKICLSSNHSIMKNIPLPPVEINCNMTVIKSEDTLKNTLMIRLDIALLKAKTIEDDINSILNNLIGNRRELQKEIKALANLYNEIDDNTCITIYKEFRDGF